MTDSKQQGELAAAHVQIIDLQAQTNEQKETIKKLKSNLRATKKKLKAALDELGQEVSDEVADILKRSCINCGATGRTTHKAGVYTCASCGHNWTAAEEDAPFRRMA